MTYVEKARHYAEGVVAGVIPACLYVRQACQRQLADLAEPPTGYRKSPRPNTRANSEPINNPSREREESDPGVYQREQLRRQ